MQNVQNQDVFVVEDDDEDDQNYNHLKNLMLMDFVVDVIHLVVVVVVVMGVQLCLHQLVIDLLYKYNDFLFPFEKKEKKIFLI